MTDIEKVRKLFTELGIDFKNRKMRNGGSEILCEEGDSKIDGYALFYTSFEFDKDGKFFQMGAWE